jgi:hypothetical protein
VTSLIELGSGAERRLFLADGLKSRVDALSCFQLFKKLHPTKIMPSKKIDHIELANSRSIEEFIDEYLPPSSVTFSRSLPTSVSKLRLTDDPFS